MSEIGTIALFLLRCLTIGVFTTVGVRCFKGIKAEWGAFVVVLLGMGFVGAFLLFDKNQTQNGLTRKLGKLLGTVSLPIFLNHRYWVAGINNVIKNYHLDINTPSIVVLFLSLTFTSAAANNVLTDLIVSKIDKMVKKE